MCRCGGIGSCGGYRRIVRASNWMRSGPAEEHCGWWGRGGHGIGRGRCPHGARIEWEALGTSRGELRRLEAMGKETANIHVGTEEKRRAILKDLRARRGNWLLGAAQAMAGAVEKDWRVWREGWEGETLAGPV